MSRISNLHFRFLGKRPVTGLDLHFRLFWGTAGNRTRFAFCPLGAKLLLRSVKPSRATCPRQVAFRLVRVLHLSIPMKKHPLWGAFSLVPVTGLEPVRMLLRGILSPLCLPISPYRHSVAMVSHFDKTVKHYNWSRFNKNAGRHSSINQFSSAHSMAFMESMVCLAADSNSVLPAFCSSMHLM